MNTGPAHSRNPSSGSSRVHASSRRSSSLLKQQLYTSNRSQSSYPCQTPGPQQEDVTRPHLAPSGQGMVDGHAADGEGDLHEAVRVHRAVPLVEVAARVGRHGLGQVEQALAGAYRRGLVHLRTVTPPACPG